MKLAIIAGHHGPGTGAAYLDRDEWAFNVQTAVALYSRIAGEGSLPCDLRYVNQSFPGPHAEEQIFELKAAWARGIGATHVIEIHYNSQEDLKAPLAEGNELLWNVGTEAHWVACLQNGLATLPNPHRPGFAGPHKRIFTILPELQVAIVEPAFLFEDRILEPSWIPTVCNALKAGLYEYFGLEAQNG